MKKVAIMDYNMNNVESVVKAFKILGAEAFIVKSKEDLERADCVVLPGVGAFGDGIKNLEESGLLDALKKEVLKNKKPFLGICLGMQLLSKEGFEGGRHKGLGWIPAVVKRLELKDNSFKLPHVGWNEVNPNKDSKLFSGLNENANFYFIHSYAVVPEDKKLVAATCDYGGEFAAGIEYGNIFGTQFHPEKSQKNGFAILKNFLEVV